MIADRFALRQAQEDLEFALRKLLVQRLVGLAAEAWSASSSATVGVMYLRPRETVRIALTISSRIAFLVQVAARALPQQVGGVMRLGIAA